MEEKNLIQDNDTEENSTNKIINDSTQIKKGKKYSIASLIFGILSVVSIKYIYSMMILPLSLSITGIVFGALSNKKENAHFIMIIGLTASLISCVIIFSWTMVVGLLEALFPFK